MNILEDLKALRKVPFTKLALQSYIIDIMENFFYSMFEYKNFPDSMPKEYAERYLIWYGCAAAGKIPEEYNRGLHKGNMVFLHAAPAEDPDAYGIGSELIVTSCNGFCEQTGYEKYAFGWNNSAHSSLRTFIMSASDAITKALCSLRAGVNYTKNHPIYKARDDKEKAALEEYWKKIMNDEDNIAIASYNIMDELIEGQQNANNNIINLSDPEHSQSLQYVTQIVDAYMRWCYGLYGQSIQDGSGKLAQQSVDEINGRVSTSFILPNDMLYQRKLWCNRMKELGIVPENAEIDFATAFKVEEIKYTAAAEQAANEADIEAETQEEKEVIEDAGEKEISEDS